MKKILMMMLCATILFVGLFCCSFNNSGNARNECKINEFLPKGKSGVVTIMDGKNRPHKIIMRGQALVDVDAFTYMND